MGFRAKQFEYETTEGIHFLAAGGMDGHLDNKALLFYHDVVNQKLTWRFKLTRDFSNFLDQAL